MSSVFFLNLLTVSIPLAAVVVLLLIISKLYGKRLTAKCRYIIWAAVILRLCIPFGAVMLPSMYEVDIPAEVELTTPHTNTDTTNYTPVGTDALQITPSVNPSVPVIDSNIATEPSENEKEPEQPQPLVIDTAVITRLLSYIWLAGAAIFLAWKLIAYNISIAELLRSSETAPETDTALYHKLCEIRSVKHAPELLIGIRASSPMLCGYFKPRIILPDIELSQNSLVGILAHELTHYRRRDLWIKLLCVFAESLHWWSPLVHIAAKRCNAEMELSCDEAVLAGLDEETRRSYGNVMLDIIKRCRKQNVTFTTQFNPKKNAVKERFYGIMDMTKKKRGLWNIAGVVLMCIVAGTVIGCNIGSKTTPDYAVYWGYYLRCDNGSDMILIDSYNSDGSPAPCSMTAENDSISFADLTDGDRIKIEVMLISETYPMQTQVYGIEKIADGERSDIDADMLAQLAEMGWIGQDNNQADDLPEEISSLLSMMVSEIKQKYGELALAYSEEGPGYPVYSLEKFPGVTVAYNWSMEEPLNDSMIPNEVIITDAYKEDITGVSVGDNIEDTPKIWTADSYSLINGTVTMYADSGTYRISLVLVSDESGWNMEFPEDSEAYNKYIKTWLSDFSKAPTGTVAQIRIKKHTAAEAPLTITSIDDWEQLGLPREDFRYPFFKAFLERDTVALEKLSNCPAGLYDSYKQIEFGNYQINRIKPTPQSEYAYTLAIEIIKGTDALPAGNYQFVYNEYPGNCLLRIFPVNNNSSEAYVVLKNLLNTTRDYALDGGNSDSFNWGLTEYIIGRLSKTQITEKDISDYAQKYLGIDAFKPYESCLGDDGYYYIPAHGGDEIICEPVSTEYDETSGEYTVTVQFYADYGMTVYSHRVEYRMKYDGTDWAFLGYEVQSKGEFEPYKYST